MQILLKIFEFGLSIWSPYFICFLIHRGKKVRRFYLIIYININYNTGFHLLRDPIILIIIIGVLFKTVMNFFWE